MRCYLLSINTPMEQQVSNVTEHKAKGYRSSVTLRHPRFSHVADVEVSISANHNEPRHQADFGDVATINFETGQCRVHCYATPAALRTLAERLIAAAQVIEDAQLIAAREVEAAQ